jgi:hypothetical protein
MELLAAEDPSSKESAQESSKEPTPALNDPQLSFQIMGGLPADLDWKQSLLELRSERERLVRVVRYLQQVIDQLDGSPDQRAEVRRAASGTA